MSDILTKEQIKEAAELGAKDYNYWEYCMMLQDMYGLPDNDYFVKWDKGKYGVFRTNIRKTGFDVHHIMEIYVPNLNRIDKALETIEYQKRKYLCYANPFEHYMLHYLIWKQSDRTDNLENGLRLLLDKAWRFQNNIVFS